MLPPIARTHQLWEAWGDTVAGYVVPLPPAGIAMPVCTA